MKDSIRDAVLEAVNSPKVAVAVSTATTAIGAAAAGELIHGILVNLSMLAGIIASSVLIKVHWTRYKILKRQLDNLEAYKEEV